MTAVVSVSPFPIREMALKDVVNTPRFAELNRLESYYAGSQATHLLYDWDGNFDGMTSSTVMSPGWDVPIKDRKPCATSELPQSIVDRFSAMIFGEERWPEISFPGDADAEDYAKALVSESHLQVKMMMARSQGGACGTACLSFGFVDGEPCVRTHSAKNCTVFAWANADKLRPAAVLEAYLFKTEKIEGGKVRTVDYYYVRYWDQEREILWAPIPKNIGDEPGWDRAVQAKETRHGFGFCPFYWIQNIPNPGDVDGTGDYAYKHLKNFDAIDRLVSSTYVGTVANNDPTLVVRADPNTNEGTLRKGSRSAIFAPGGADYLEISGAAVKASHETERRIRNNLLESTQCVISDPDRMAAQAASGEALRIMFAPMTAKCDLERAQYGATLREIVKDMLCAARTILTSPGYQDAEGTLHRQSVVLPPRVVRSGEGAAETVTLVPRTPGQSTYLELNWPPYFAATWDDIYKGVQAARAASGDKPVMSRRTSVKLISPLSGVDNIDEELLQIEEDEESAAEMASKAFDMGAGSAEFASAAGTEEDDSEDEEDEEGDSEEDKKKEGEK